MQPHEWRKDTNMIKKFRNRKIGKENQKELEVMLTAICIDDDAEIGESIIRNLERGKTEDVAVEVYVRPYQKYTQMTAMDCLRNYFLQKHLLQIACSLKPICAVVPSVIARGHSLVFSERFDEMTL